MKLTAGNKLKGSRTRTKPQKLLIKRAGCSCQNTITFKSNHIEAQGTEASVEKVELFFTPSGKSKIAGEQWEAKTELRLGWSVMQLKGMLSCPSGMQRRLSQKEILVTGTPKWLVELWCLLNELMCEMKKQKQIWNSNSVTCLPAIPNTQHRVWLSVGSQC